jgi:hypothetical protein
MEEITTPNATEPITAPVTDPKVDPKTPTEPVQDSKPSETAPKPDDKMASKFAALSRREKEARLLRKEADAKLSEVSAYKKEIEEAKADPIAFLEKKFGVSYDDLTMKRLEKGPINKESEVVQELKSQVQALLDERNTEKQTAQQMQKETVINGFKTELTKTIDANKDKFPLLAAQNGENPLAGILGTELVYDVIDHHFMNTGDVLPADQAFEAIEKHLEKSIESILLLPKVQELLKKLAKPSEPEKVHPSNSKTPSENKTLKNSQSATNPHRANGKLNDQEDFKRAVELLRSGISA